MSISQRKTKQGLVFEIRYRDAQGRSRRETLGTREQGWDKRKARQAELALLADRTGRPSPVFKDVAEDWLRDCSDNWKPRTRSAYKRSIKRLDHFWEMQIGQIRPRHIAEWIPTRTCSPKTTNDDISVLHQIFKYAMNHELVDSNPASSAPRPKIRKRQWRILTPEEIQKVDKAFESISFDDKNSRWDEATARKQAQLMFRVLTRTGIRRDELRRLRVRDIDFDRCVIRIRESKTEEGERSIAIPKSLATDLKEWCERG